MTEQTTETQTTTLAELEANWREAIRQWVLAKHMPDRHTAAGVERYRRAVFAELEARSQYRYAVEVEIEVEALATLAEIGGES